MLYKIELELESEAWQSKRRGMSETRDGTERDRWHALGEEKRRNEKSLAAEANINQCSLAASLSISLSNPFLLVAVEGNEDQANMDA